MQNFYSFPLTIYRVKLSGFASEYFEIVDFNSPVLIESNLNASEILTPVFKLIFNRAKFVRDYFEDYKDLQGRTEGENKNAQQPNYFSEFICIIQTNFTDFEIPLKVYDGLISVVSYFKKIHRAKSIQRLRKTNKTTIF